MANSDIYGRLAAAYVRGYAIRTGQTAIPKRLLDAPLDALAEEDVDALVGHGAALKLKMYRFKRAPATMARVRFALGALYSLAPESVCDVGSGRGAFLFPFLNAFPTTRVDALDLLDYRVETLMDVRRGGVETLFPKVADICSDALPDKSVDVVTALEVLEHIPDYAAAIAAATRIARRSVLVTVPAEPDDNPEHIHLLAETELTAAFHAVGVTRLNFGRAGQSLTLVANLN